MPLLSVHSSYTTSLNIQLRLNSSPLYFFSLYPLSDNQAIRHCHCTNTRTPAPPHHADHGLCAAALPEAGQHGEDWPREELQHTILAGVSKTHDSWKLLGQLAGTHIVDRCNCYRGLARIQYALNDIILAIYQEMAPCIIYHIHHSSG